MSAHEIIIVGGGVTGLAAAHALGNAEGVHVTLLESSARLGGNILTERHDGFTIDAGPDSWLATKPHATALARTLGLEDEMIPTVEATRRVYVAWEKELHVLPEGLVLAVPTEILPILKTGLFSWDAKLRMGLEPVIIPRDLSGDNDESIADFVTRRLGEQVTDRLAGPLLGGVFAGDASKLSIRATFPQFVEAERAHGSLIRAMRAARKKNAAASTGKAPSAFVSLRGGMDGLVDALARSLGTATVRTRAAVINIAALEGKGRRFAVQLASGEVLRADQVLFAAPAYAVAAALKGLDERIADALGAFHAASSATVFLAFRREHVSHPLDGVGFIVPHALGRSILAATWITSKWEHRAPEGYVLMRAFFGGARNEAVLAFDDRALVALARSELNVFMGLTHEPLFAKVFRFHRASPQPAVGHLTRFAKVRAMFERWPGLDAAGGGYEGMGIPDCVRQGQDMAARAKARVAPPNDVRPEHAGGGTS